MTSAPGPILGGACGAANTSLLGCSLADSKNSPLSSKCAVCDIEPASRDVGLSGASAIICADSLATHCFSILFHSVAGGQVSTISLPFTHQIYCVLSTGCGLNDDNNCPVESERHSISSEGLSIGDVVVVGATPAGRLLVLGLAVVGSVYLVVLGLLVVVVVVVDVEANVDEGGGVHH